MFFKPISCEQALSETETVVEKEEEIKDVESESSADFD